jgi:aminopeptidase Y
VFESRLVIGNGVPDSAAVMRMSPPTPKKQPVTGPLVLVANGGCDASDYPADVKGAVALIKRGTCSFDAKSANAGKAGAAAAVIYNNEAGGETTYGTLGQPSDDHVPTWGMNNAEGSHYAKYLEAGTALDVSAYVDSVVNNIKTLNVLAQTRGGDPDHCVMIGGHSDGVGAGPGINDDGTGSITVLEVATQLTKFEVNNCVRFAWWAAEEEGLLGSDYYVSQLSEEESMKIRLFMDYDMVSGLQRSVSLS